VAGIAQFHLVHNHPFVDGNGRTARLLSTLCLYRAGYDFKRLFTLSEYYDRDRSRFYAALQAVREHDMDLTGWLDYFVTGLAAQLDEVKARGLAVIRADVTGQAHGLSRRQVELLGELLTASPRSLAELAPAFPGVSRRTLQRDLKVLLEQGLLKELAQSPTDPTRAYVATPTPEL
jgi:Fic family protein